MDVEESCDSRVLDVPCLLYISAHMVIFTRSMQDQASQRSGLAGGKGELLAVGGCWRRERHSPLGVWLVVSYPQPSGQSHTHALNGQHWLYSGLLIGKRKEKEWRVGSVVKSTFEMTQILFPAHTSGSSQSFIIPAPGDLTPHPTPL